MPCLVLGLQVAGLYPGIFDVRLNGEGRRGAENFEFQNACDSKIN